MEICAVRVLDINQEKLCLLISPEKRYKVERFVYKKDKLRILIGEILIRTMISKELEMNNSCIIFEKNKYGKPYIRDFQELNFNISYSGDFVVCAIDKKPIGIDIEEIKSIEYEKIAKNFFASSEFDYVTKIDPDDCLCKFYEMWTLKESYIKCCRKGLSISLNSFSIEKDEFGNIKVVSGHKDNIYRFTTVSIDFNYKIAVCLLSKEVPDSITVVRQDDLINSYLKILLD